MSEGANDARRPVVALKADFAVDALPHELLSPLGRLQSDFAMRRRRRRRRRRLPSMMVMVVALMHRRRFGVAEHSILVGFERQVRRTARRHTAGLPPNALADLLEDSECLRQADGATGDSLSTANLC